ncbi:MAG: hypothetical protein MRY83_16825 [Flavobacteriales bacterium]|nr:hypothetical protein [Flavobacteriales bacterium]
MKKITLLLCLLLLPALSVGSDFDRDYYEKTNNNVSILPSEQYFFYDEITPAGSVTDNDGGSLFGVTIDFRKSISNFVLGLNADYYQGKVSYMFFPMGMSPVMQSPDQTLFSYAISLLRPILIAKVADGMVVEPLSKLGRRQWERNTSPENTIASYEEIYYNYFYGAGLGLVFFVKKLYIYTQIILGGTIQPQNGSYVLQQLDPVVRLGPKFRFETLL